MSVLSLIVHVLVAAVFMWAVQYAWTRWLLPYIESRDCSLGSKITKPYEPGTRVHRR